MKSNEAQKEAALGERRLTNKEEKKLCRCDFMHSQVECRGSSARSL